jgi:hypothetical protein
MQADAVTAIAAFQEAVRPVIWVSGLYADSSLGRADGDVGALGLVAITESRPGRRGQRRLRRAHRRLSRAGGPAARLTCCYVPETEAPAITARYLTWVGGRFGRQPLTAIARAGLLRGGIVISGPPPSRFLPPLDDAALRRAVSRELASYWRPVAARRRIWLRDSCVDLGLITLAQAGAILADGRLITREEAISRLGDLGVPAGLAAEIARRQTDEPVPSALRYRLRRARTARRLMAAGIADLLRQLS